MRDSAWLRDAESVAIIKPHQELGRGFSSLDLFQKLKLLNDLIAIAMSSSRPDPMLVLKILTGLTGGIKIFTSMPLLWLRVFKYLIQCHCTGWGHLNEK